MQTEKSWPWVTVGVGALGLGLTTFLVYRHYQLEQRRSREASDPRTQQVRALIDEAETLLHLGRRGTPDSH